MNARQWLVAAMCFVAGVASAQVQPVSVNSGVNWPLAGVVLFVVLAVIAFVVWKQHATPEQEKQAEKDVRAALLDVANKAHDSVLWAHSHIEALIARIPEAPKPAPEAPKPAQDTPTAIPAPANAATGPQLASAPVPEPIAAPVSTGPTPEQMAAIATARNAYLSACEAAGIKPLPVIS